MILVDTSVWIDFFIGRNTRYRDNLHQLIEKEEDICIAEIILTEILQGIRDEDAYEAAKNYILEFPIIRPRGAETYIMAAEIYRRCRREGKTIRKTIDCIIAAIVKENNLTLFHNDNDFDVIKKYVGLKAFEMK